MRQFRGISNVYIAEVIQDDATGYTTGTPQRLAYAARVAKDVTSDSATLYYDNMAMAVVNSEGSDAVTIEGSALELDTLALITGKIYDNALGMYVDGERTVKNFALGYEEKMLDGSKRFNWRLKGTFAIPSTESSTENDGTDSNGQTVNFTGIFTTKTFTKANGKGAKAVVVTDELAETSDWFTEVKTPDTVQAKTPSL